jgi:hypothetical protein
MSKADDIASVEVHPAAEKLFRQLVNEYATSILYQAKLLAYRRRDDAVLGNHIEEAQDIVEQQRKRNRVRELQIIFGSALLGAFIPGFIAELSNGNPGLIVIWVLAGFIGIFLVLWALRAG